MPRAYTSQQRAEAHAKIRGELSTKAMTAHQGFFFQGDVDFDCKLNFLEFANVLPPALRSRPLSELRSWFDLIDADRDNVLTLEEFFRWSMTAASMVTGLGITEIFKQYDKENSGSLARDEFYLAAAGAGFGDLAADLVEELPRGSSGKISYVDLLNTATDLRVSERSSTMKSFLCAMAWDKVECDSKVRGVNLSSGVFTTHDVDALHTELCKVLRYHALHLEEVLSWLDRSNDKKVSEDEWVDGLLNILRFQGPPDLLRQVFRTMDTDGTGHVDLDEVEVWMHCHHEEDQRKLKSKIDAMVLRVGEGDEPWTADRLLTEMQWMFSEAEVSVKEALKGWDTSGDGDLSRREFLQNVKRCVSRWGTTEHQWWTTLRGAALELFGVYDRDGNGILKLKDLARWIDSEESASERWRRQRRQRQSGFAAKRAATKREMRAPPRGSVQRATSLPELLHASSPSDPTTRTSPAALWSDETRAQLEGYVDVLKPRLRRLAEPRWRSAVRSKAMVEPLPPLMQPSVPSDRLLSSTVANARRRLPECGLPTSLSAPKLSILPQIAASEARARVPPRPNPRAIVLVN